MRRIPRGAPRHPHPDRPPAWAGSVLPVALAVLLVSPCFADHALNLVLVDAETGAPTAARLSVTGSDTFPHRPFPDSLCLFHGPLGGYFYSDSAAAIVVPTGPTRVRASKGPEYLPFDARLNVVSDTTLVVSLVRLIEPRNHGWVGGDAHVHLSHAPVTHNLNAADARLLMRAEGLRVATFLENGYLFTGEVNLLSDSSAVFLSSEEYRSPLFGHLGLLGIDTLLVPFAGAICWPANTPVAERVRGHAHALASYAHPYTTDDYFDVSDWPGTGLARGIWVDAALGAASVLDVLSYSNLAAPGFTADSLWTRLWNSGFTFSGLAGTDASPGRADAFPIGALRVYVRVPDPWAPPGDLYDAWVEGARRGRTFVTTGPLITAFDVGGAGAGETLHTSSDMPLDLPLHARFESIRRLGRIDVIRNGDVVRTIHAGGANTFEFSTVVPVRETSWIAVRHDDYAYDDFHPTTRSFAQPTPVLVLLDGDGLTSAASGSYALGQIDLLDSLLSLVAEYPSPEESLAVAGGIETARVVWEARSNAPPKSFHLDEPCYACLLPDTLPTFLWTAACDPDPSGTVTYRLVLAEDAEFEHVLVDTSGLAAAMWTPPLPLEIGRRYWWRVRAEDAEGAALWAEEIDWWFEPAVETGVAEDGDAAVFFAPSPNPADLGARGVVFSWHAPRGGPGAVTIFTPGGREVRRLAFPTGAGSLVWDGSDGAGRRVPGGVYLYRVELGSVARTGKICVVR